MTQTSQPAATPPPPTRPTSALLRKRRSKRALSLAARYLGTGLGATLKSVGRGGASKEGELRMHHDRVPTIDAEVCTGCGTCAEW